MKCIVAPADTSGWYPNPSLDATDTIIPPVGTVAVLTSLAIDDAVPVNVIEAISSEMINYLELSNKKSKVAWLLII